MGAAGSLQNRSKGSRCKARRDSHVVRKPLRDSRSGGLVGHHFVSGLLGGAFVVIRLQRYQDRVCPPSGVPAGSLLDDVGKLMGDQPIGFPETGPVFAIAEDDMAADRISPRSDLPCRTGGFAVRVDANATEIVSEAAFHKAARAWIQRAAGAGQHSFNAGCGGGGCGRLTRWL
jgi:hypothetical protein